MLIDRVRAFERPLPTTAKGQVTAIVTEWAIDLNPDEQRKKRREARDAEQKHLLDTQQEEVKKEDGEHHLDILA